MVRPRDGRLEAAALAGLGILIVAGCVLRFWTIAERGFWYDELWAVVGASDRPLTEVYREWMLGDSHPPGFFLANFLWFKIAPVTELWARLPSALASIAVVVYLLVGTGQVLSRDERVYAAAFFSLSFFPIYYAGEVKQYSWVLLFATMATISCVGMSTARLVDRRHAVLFTASIVGLAWLDYFGTAYAGLLLLLLTVRVVGEPANRHALLGIGVVFALCYVPVLPFLYDQLRYAPGHWQRPDYDRLLPTLIASLFFDDPAWLWAALALTAGALGLASVVRPADLQAVRSRRTVQMFVLWVGITAAILGVGLWQPVMFPRYFLVMFSPCLILLGIVAAGAFPVRVWWLAAVPLTVFARGAIVQHRMADVRQTQQWGGSVDLVLAQLQPGDRVFVLGAKTDKTSFEYLKEGDVDGVFYVKNVSFYEYYFRRRGAGAIVSPLEVVEPDEASAEALGRRFRGSGTTVFVLAGHHIAFSERALDALRRSATKVQTTELRSTIVYALRFDAPST